MALRDAKGRPIAKLDSQFVDPESPIVIAVENMGTSIVHTASIIRDLADGTIAESFIDTWKSKDLDAKVQAKFNRSGLSANKRFEFWMSPDMRFIELLIPSTDQTKLRSFISQEVNDWSKDLTLTEKVEAKKKLIPDAANKQESGDMFWYKPSAPQTVNIGCHYYSQCYERCSVALVEKGVAKSEFEMRWKQRYARRRVYQGFRQSIRSGIQMRLDSSKIDSPKDIVVALKRALPNSPNILDTLFEFIEDRDSREYWVDVSRSAIRYGKRSDEFQASTGLTAAHVASMPTGSLFRLAGFLPSKIALGRLHKRGMDALDREQGSANQRARSGSNTAKRHSEEIASWKSIMAKLKPYIDSIGNRPFYGFLKLTRLPKHLSGGYTKWGTVITRLLKIGLVQEINQTISNDDIDAFLQSVAKNINDADKRRVRERSNQQNQKATKRQRSAADALPVTFARHEATHLKSGATAGWDIVYSPTGETILNLGSIWRKQRSMIYGSSDPVGDFLISKKENKKAGLSLILASDAKKWVDTCAVTTGLAAPCRELFEISNLASVGESIKSLGASSLVVEQVNIVAKRIKKIDMGVVTDKGESIGRGQILFDFN